MFDRVRDGTIPMRAWASLKVLFMGYAAGIVLAAIFTILAISTRIGTDFLETITAMFNPLPAIALLPLALIWFGLGNGSLVFVLIHSVLWPVALNTHSGFKSVSNTLRMVGRNYGLRGLPYVARILIPAAFGSILTGLKIGWAFAWRTLIAAELVFGVSSGQGGLGWFIFENRNLLDIPAVFAGLLTVIVIGLIVENLIFRTIERNTVQKWGTQSGATRRTPPTSAAPDGSRPTISAPSAIARAPCRWAMRRKSGKAGRSSRFSTPGRTRSPATCISNRASTMSGAAS